MDVVFYFRVISVSYHLGIFVIVGFQNSPAIEWCNHCLLFSHSKILKEKKLAKIARKICKENHPHHWEKCRLRPIVIVRLFSRGNGLGVCLTMIKSRRWRLKLRRHLAENLLRIRSFLMWVASFIRVPECHCIVICVESLSLFLQRTCSFWRHQNFRVIQFFCDWRKRELADCFTPNERKTKYKLRKTFKKKILNCVFGLVLGCAAFAPRGLSYYLLILAWQVREFLWWIFSSREFWR